MSHKNLELLVLVPTELILRDGGADATDKYHYIFLYKVSFLQKQKLGFSIKRIHNKIVLKDLLYDRKKQSITSSWMAVLGKLLMKKQKRERLFQIIEGNFTFNNLISIR